MLVSSPSNQGQDLFGEGDDHATSQSKETVGPLGGVVAFQGQADLDNTEAEQDHADRPDQAEDESGQVVDDSQRIVHVVFLHLGCY